MDDWKWYAGLVLFSAFGASHLGHRALAGDEPAQVGNDLPPVDVEPRSDRDHRAAPARDFPTRLPRAGALLFQQAVVSRRSKAENFSVDFNHSQIVTGLAFERPHSSMRHTGETLRVSDPCLTNSCFPWAAFL